LNRDAGSPPFKDVLIIGAGSGNDVATALAQGAGHVDAVEIDPMLDEIGRRHHPNHHGADPRVTRHIDDGRSFVQSTRNTYDLIVYALVDSLVLHSGYSSIRLESFLFTEQAFRDLRDHLKPGGVLVIYNYYRQGWVVGRLASAVRRVFGTDPIVLSLPYRATIAPEDRQGNCLTYFIAGTEQSPAFHAIRARFRENRFFWVHQKPAANRYQYAYRPVPPKVGGTYEAEWYKMGPAQVETERVGPLPTDDFPFLYLRGPVIPGLNLRGMLIVVVLSLAILLAFAPIRTARPNGQMFFLGAGFMLLETKGVVHMALLFGSTWMVNSIVFAAILIMALLSNLYVLVKKPRRLGPYYALLVASLLLNLAMPMTSFLALSGVTKTIVSCLVVFVPILFAGVVFAASFRASERPDLDFGSNIGGVILGGLSENLSLVVGFNNLLFIAIAYYLLSAVFAPRLGGITAAAPQ
jgi:SAM-dependent methyltransferase